MAAVENSIQGSKNFAVILDELANRLSGKSVLKADEATGDSDKTFTVPADVAWVLESIWVELTAAVAVGDRRVTVQIQDGDSDVLAEVRAGAVVGALEVRNFFFAPHVPDLTAFRDTDFLMTPLPKFLLPAGYQVRVFDRAAISAAGDDMIVQMLVREYVEI